jgi:cell division protein FtsQ
VKRNSRTHAPHLKAKPNTRPGERKASWLRAGAWVFTLALALLLTAGLSLACLIGFRWATTSSFFAVHEIAVSGNARLDKAFILDLAEVRQGLNVFELGLGETERKLAANPWVESAMVRRVLPGRIEIMLTEHKPAFWKVAGDSLVYADAAGQVIAPVEQEKFTSLPLLAAEEGNAGEPARLMAQMAGRGLPLNPADAQWIRLRGGAEVVMYFEEFDLTMTLDAGELEENVRLVARAWDDLERRGELGRTWSMTAMDGRVWVGMR